MLYTSYIKSHIPYLSQIRAVASDKGLCRIIFDSQHEDITDEIVKDDLAIFIELKKQLDLYALKKLTEFTVPLDIQGTPYRKKIWGLLQTIPYGRVASYKDIADKIQQHHRPVGGANRANPLPIIIPCHRVISHDGAIGGYAYGIELKKTLLALEGVCVEGEFSNYNPNYG